jgi:hypothetical protein
MAHVKAAPDFIDFLQMALRSPDLYMAKTTYGDALVFTLERDTMTPTDAWNHAAAIVREVIGSLHAFANLIGPISVVAPVSVSSERRLGESILATLDGTVRIYSKEGRAALLRDTPDAVDTVMSRIIRVARDYPEVARALSLLDDHNPSWSDIYLLMEIVEMNLRSRDHRHTGKDWVAIVAHNWLPAAAVRAMKRNAGYHRHAKQFDPPSPPMALRDAQRNCKSVVAKWLENLSTGSKV